MNSEEVIDGINELIDELENVRNNVELDGLENNHRDDLESQSGVINTILTGWVEADE
jgi:hypothetical protein